MNGALVRTTLALLLAVLLAAGCGDDGDTGDDGTRSDRDDAAQVDDDANEDADEADHDSMTDEEHAEGEADPLPPIQVIAPPTFSSVHRSFVLSGTAQVFEAELRWAILDADLEPLASGRMMASCGAPCRGDFSTRVDVSKVPLGSWELHVYAPPVADDDPPRVHDVILPITVVANPVDQPAADAPPPGGVPNDL